MIITKKRNPEEAFEFGPLLKQKMTDKKISMKSLGKVAGVHRTTISDYAAGKYLPKEETFHRIHQVIPDKDLYDSYFKAVSKSEPRKNKQIIPEASAYNYYKAETEDATKAAEVICKALSESKTSNISTLDKEYIACALKLVLNYFNDNDIMKQLAPSDYANYVRLYEEYSKK